MSKLYIIESEFDKHELNYISRYEAIGYTDQYRVVSEELEHLISKQRYSPIEVLIMKEHCYVGESNPLDMSLLYVIQTSDGTKGTMLASYGANGNTSIHEFMNWIPEKNIKDDLMLPPGSL